MSAVFKKDEELSSTEKYGTPDVAFGYMGDENAVHADELVKGTGFIGCIQRFGAKLGVEQRGIERVPSDERTDTSMSSVGTLVCPPPRPSTIDHRPLSCPFLCTNAASGCPPTW